ncbi:4-demethylwyosine synthase TYW1 [Nanoarchaeota archaeon]
MTDKDWNSYKQKLEKQGYRFTGSHSAVKICEWTRKSIVNKGICYKQKFYGINCHRCAQISVTANFCDHDCVFCWREHANFPFTEVDEPSEIIDKTIEEQKQLLIGFKGNDIAEMERVNQAFSPKHFAISLTGETLYYPKLSELIKELKNRNLTSFIVTNGQLPEVLEKLEPPTQLYISLDAPNKELYQKVDKPLRKDGWERLMKSLEILKKLKGKTRTALRITLIKGINDINPKQYAELIEKASPNYVEVKAYMFIGVSRQRLVNENMPEHNEVVEFSKKICENGNYKLIDEQAISRVTLLMKEDKKDRIMKFD